MLDYFPGNKLFGGRNKMAVKLTNQLDYWQQHILNHRKSGLSKMQYCKIHKVVYSQFLYWSRKEDKLDRQVNAKSNAQQFIPVKMRQNEANNLHQMPAPTQPRSTNANKTLTENKILCSVKLKQGHELFVYNAVALETILQVFNG